MNTKYEGQCWFTIKSNTTYSSRRWVLLIQSMDGPVLFTVVRWGGAKESFATGHDKHQVGELLGNPDAKLLCALCQNVKMNAKSKREQIKANFSFDECCVNVCSGTCWKRLYGVA